MCKNILFLSVGFIFALSSPAWPQMDHSMHDMESTTNALIEAEALDLSTLKAGQVNTFIIKLSDTNGTPLTLDQLQEIHTQKVHFLIVDESLNDYHHLHPTAGKKPGTYVASFTPTTGHTYKLWADITPTHGKQKFVPVSLKGAHPCEMPCVEKTVTFQATAHDLKASLFFESALKAGQNNMGRIEVTDTNGKPVTDLEPIMGTFGHIVAFYEDFDTVAHIHPMGKEPESAADRGGPEILFHLTPEKEGFLKLFAQIKRGGKDIFIPFGTPISK